MRSACLLSFAILLAATQKQRQVEPLSAGRPILNRCRACHSGASPAAGLSLSSRYLALKGGKSGAALIPGSPDKSLLFTMVSTRKMPPGAPLSQGEIDTIRNWIASGAAWTDTTPNHTEPKRAGLDWWSLQPVRRPAIPKVRNASWVRNSIDAFVMAKLESRGLSPAPPADRRTLIRRATFDLIGLPPTPEEIDTFVNDGSSNAYEKLVDRLLASPHYGERWGRHWLDVARFAESQGYERDIIRDHAWRYRDYVINSLNQDKPYNQFVQEQLAGDVLQEMGKRGNGETNPDRAIFSFPHSSSFPQVPISSYADRVTATGFLVAGPWDEVGNTVTASAVLRARVREEELEDIVSEVSQTFFGLTVNCARCHDHKFDPIPQADYYRLKAALDGVKHGNRPLLSEVELKERETKVEAAKQTIARMEREIAPIEQSGRRKAAAAKGLDKSGLPQPIAQWTFDIGPGDVIGSSHGVLTNGATVQNGRLKLSGNNAYMVTAPLSKDLREKTLEAWVSLPNLTQRGGGVVSIETPDGRQFDSIVFGEREPAKWIAGSDGFQRTKDLPAPVETANAGDLIHVAVVYGTDNSITVYRNGVPYAAPYVPAAHDLRTYRSGESHVLLGLRHTGAGNGFLSGEIEEARVYDRALSPIEIDASFRAGYVNLSEYEIIRALSNDEKAEYHKLADVIHVQREALKKLAGVPQAYAANSVQPGATHVLLRGDVESLGEPVRACGLSAVRTMSADLDLPADAPEGARRLKLAEWITDPRNPLTARVMVNRVWHYHFGRGIVGSPNDFGFNGDRPSHPELLDWLAAEFVRSNGVSQVPEAVPHVGTLEYENNIRTSAASLQYSSTPWSIKRLHRLIMLSNTYRQSARYNPRAAEIDADDRLLWRFAPQRLEGEAVRDAMLSVSGQLNPAMGGPSFRPFTIYVNHSHLYSIIDPIGPEFDRRTIYRINVNSAKNPLLETLDCPDPSTKTPRRTTTTTPLQALALMNNSFVLRQAEKLAERVRSEVDVSKQISLAYRLTLGRPPNAKEAKRGARLSQEHGLSNLCWALLNSSEFLYVR